jgi:hypothetical protein
MNFTNFIEMSIKRAMEIIHERFENKLSELEFLHYHNMTHSSGVMDRAELIMSAMQKADPSLVSDRDIQLARLAGAWHDVVQHWEINIVEVAPGLVKKLRKRLTGNNEKESAQELAEWAIQTNKNAQKEIFSTDDIAVCSTAILATIPTFNMDYGTVHSLHLSMKSPLVAHAVAFADLGDNGMSEPALPIMSGDCLFREDNLDMYNLPVRVHTLSGTMSDFYQTRMVEWAQRQVNFFVGKEKHFFDTELLLLPEQVRGNVANLFCKFPELIEESERTRDRRKTMNLKQLLDEMGYAI